MAMYFDDLKIETNALRQEIPGMVAPGIANLRTEIDGAMHHLNDAAIVEIRQHVSSTAQQVTSEVDVKFQNAAVGFQAEQERLNTILHAEHIRLTSLVDKLSADVRAAVEKVSSQRRQARRGGDSIHRAAGHDRPEQGGPSSARSTRSSTGGALHARQQSLR